ncbi:flagellar biosynthetic protein FlhB [Arthrobacter sp. AG258]|uniref:EscU/YscU/HrcU family type III secretion system export apparatus switch protein n=1 Tax=Arthrobacter sp. AG258 TaxID=2183899 RepID=UPI00105D969B|nr:EscU/YscU/HrcU family type III secretion system export apparatus switch protein [Arthrobacter sp. AG258]TDT85974.1 flagellar biosynthetic protein FlhB [Arthrobacter sp. AG258]
MADSQERTEQATDKRMREVRSKGQLSRSQDLTAWLGVGAGAVMLPATIDRAANAAVDQVFSIRSVMESPDLGKALHALELGLGSLAGILGPLLLVVFLVVLAGSAVQGGVHFKKFRPEFGHFNLLSGLKRLFGMQAVWGGLKALLKAAVVGVVLYFVVQRLIPVLLTAGGLPVSGVIAAATDGIGSLVQFAVAAGLVLAAADVLVVMRRNRKKTRMSKKEVTDENKNTEGDPLVRSHRRSRQLAMSRNRMIAAIADADVVLVNPTHVAVALKYDAGTSAPRVVAKGAGVIATRIRAEAEAKEVPMVQDIPLARALHSACGLGQEIPLELYRAVAGVLAFVMSLKARGAARGMHRMAEVP